MKRFYHFYYQVVNDFAERKKNFNVVYEAINSQLQTLDDKLQSTVRGHLNKLKVIKEYPLISTKIGERTKY